MAIPNDSSSESTAPAEGMPVRGRKSRKEVDQLMELFPNSFKEPDPDHPGEFRPMPEEKLDELEQRFSTGNAGTSNGTLQEPQQYEGGKRIFADIQDKLKKDRLRLGRFLGAGGLALVFAVEDENGKELEGAVARLESAKYGEIMEHELTAVPFLEESVTLQNMKKKPGQSEEYVFSNEEAEAEAKKDVFDDISMHLRIFPRGVQYELVTGNPKNPSLDDTLQLPGSGRIITRQELTGDEQYRLLSGDPDRPAPEDRVQLPDPVITRREMLGNVLRTLGYVGQEGDIEALARVGDPDSHPGPLTTIGPYKYEQKKMPWLDALHDIRGLDLEGTFLALPASDGGVISVGGQPLVTLSDVSCCNEATMPGLRTARKYLQDDLPELMGAAHADAAVMPREEIYEIEGRGDRNNKLKEWDEAAKSAGRPLVDEQLQRGVSEKNQINDAKREVATRYVQIYKELRSAMESGKSEEGRDPEINEAVAKLTLPAFAMEAARRAGIQLPGNHGHGHAGGFGAA